MAENEDDPRFEVEHDEIKLLLRTLAGRIDRILKEGAEQGLPRLGFGLFLFDFDGPAMFWISNADRKDMSRALREFLQREGWQ